MSRYVYKITLHYTGYRVFYITSKKTKHKSILKYVVPAVIVGNALFGDLFRCQTYRHLQTVPPVGEREPGSPFISAESSPQLPKVQHTRTLQNVSPGNAIPVKRLLVFSTRTS